MTGRATYSQGIGALVGAMLVAGQGWAGDVLVDPKDTIPAKPSPIGDPKYIDNAIKAVSIAGWGGPFRLDTDLAGGVPGGTLYLERAAVHVDQDPLARGSIALNIVFRSAEFQRLSTSVVQANGATMATVRSETEAASTFAEKAHKVTLEGGTR